MSSYDPDDPTVQTATGPADASAGGYVAPRTLGNTRKFQTGGNGGQKVATISQNYNEKTMLLSSDDEYQ